jgi:hypothetical protein
VDVDTTNEGASIPRIKFGWVLTSPIPKILEMRQEVGHENSQDHPCSCLLADRHDADWMLLLSDNLLP